VSNEIDLVLALVPSPSLATRVTLFEDRAEVTRTAEVAAASGSSWIAVGGVSPFVDERSVQIKAAGEGVRVLSARVRFHSHVERALGREAIEALEAEERAALQRVTDAERAQERAERGRERADALAASWRKLVADTPRGAATEATLASLRGALAAIARSSAEALAQAAAAREARLTALDDLHRARARLAEGRAAHPRHEARVEVQLACAEARAVSLELTYRVPCALWRPEHLVRLASAPPASGGKAPIEIVTFATAWQRTGEAWDDVAIRFSTARPARDATPPLVTDDVLTARRKTDQERSRIEVDLREQAVMVAGLDRGARAVDEMPGVDDGGEPVLLAPTEKVSLTSDGRPLRIEVGRVTVEATIDRVLFPEIARVAHLRATATLTRGGPLLAGPVRIARGQSLVGRARLDFVGKGEPFEVGLGTDDGVRVRRSHVDQRETTPVTGTQKVRRAVKVYLSNLSSEARRVLVTERIPVSEIDDIEVTLTAAGGFRSEGKDGFLHREVDLPANATQTLELGYELRASSKVVLPL
jgi:uncharacterized protein (TIGR02231 family)